MSVFYKCNGCYIYYKVIIEKFIESRTCIGLFGGFNCCLDYPKGCCMWLAGL